MNGGTALRVQNVLQRDFGPAAVAAQHRRPQTPCTTLPASATHGVRMNNKTIRGLLVAALIAALVAAVFWHHEHEALDESLAKLVASELQPIATLLTENQAIIKELQAEPFAEKDNGILESYLIKIRRNGVAKNAVMKQRLDQLAENNTAIVTLTKAYAPHAKTPAFTTEADKFREYASAWRDRWNSVMELFMAGGNYAAAEVPFPKEFPDAVQAEIAAAR